jgi:LPXTG-site transpeptidase (sortase) family protein
MNMKKIGLILIVIVGLFTGISLSGVFLSNSIQRADIPAVKSVSITPTFIPAEVSKKEISKPVTFVISKINIDTSVESVAQDLKGNMDIPKKSANVAWYNLGPKPGEKGSAVLAGHYDDPTGAPAVFYNLNSLEPGDTLEVTDEKGTRYIYSITKKEKYPVDDFPVSMVFSQTGAPMLNLITCEGIFNKSAATYSHRLVVFSELKEVKEI